jgi:hypothetical protein
LHPIAFKLIRFSGQRALGDIDFLCSLPCCFVEKDEGSDLLIEFLLRPQRPLVNPRPLIRPLAAIAFRPRHLPLPFAQTTIIFQAYPTPQKFARIRGILSQFGLPNGVKSLMRRSHETGPGRDAPLQKQDAHPS